MDKAFSGHCGNEDTPEADESFRADLVIQIIQFDNQSIYWTLPENYTNDAFVDSMQTSDETATLKNAVLSAVKLQSLFWEK